MLISPVRHYEPECRTTLPLGGAGRALLTPAACAFLGHLHAAFVGRVAEILTARERAQARRNAGERPAFPSATRALRDTDWRIAPPPADLRDRRVEITGPPDRKLIINALNSGAQVFMADFEDAHAPVWEATLAGQHNLFDAVRRRIAYTAGDGRDYRMAARTATLVVRPRGWHLPEKHFLVDGQAIPAALFDFGLYAYHNAHWLLDHGSGPYFYLPKLEGRREARLWSEVFGFAADYLGIPPGAIRATVLIETLPAAFEMDEILYELRDHATGLNCGRWDYIFSFIKQFQAHPEVVLPDREQVGMTCRFLRSYSRLLIRTCHRRGAHALGGMAAQLPVRGDPAATAAAFAKVRADKEREAGDGHDGTWVAHPDLVPVAREVFDRQMPGPNQIQRTREDVAAGADDLLAVPEGSITEAGVRGNVHAALHYLAAWLDGRGAVPINHLMEDAATAEIARAQLWQWIHCPGGVLDDGRRVTRSLFQDLLLAELEACTGPRRAHYGIAAGLLHEAVGQDRFEPFITVPAYAHLA